MNKATKTFVSNSAKKSTNDSSTNKSPMKFIAKVASTSVNRRVTISSNFSIAKIKK